ncbi:uncharacterized protein VTP21DRAFT_9884 [Calcarisporiella thermophila]|uniref:uncharacterized protein n=1 Tax=Calcarisporiella thermophila TaxID=911321 RepID=UPI0037429732
MKRLLEIERAVPTTTSWTRVATPRLLLVMKWKKPMPERVMKKGSSRGAFQPIPSRPPSEAGIPVVLHIYDLLPPSALSILATSFGIGVYHTGVELRGKEYCFGAHPYDFSGIFSVRPKVGPQGVIYKKSIFMGYCQLTDAEINRVLHRLAREYTGASYHLLARNCNHFASDLCQQLINKIPPDWVNRAARIASCFPFLVPASWINPPVFGQQGILGYEASNEKPKSWRRSWSRDDTRDDRRFCRKSWLQR